MWRSPGPCQGSVWPSLALEKPGCGPTAQPLAVVKRQMKGTVPVLNTRIDEMGRQQAHLLPPALAGNHKGYLRPVAEEGKVMSARAAPPSPLNRAATYARRADPLGERGALLLVVEPEGKGHVSKLVQRDHLCPQL